MQKDLTNEIKIIKAILQDYPIIQNLGRFYEYDMSRYCQWPWKGEDGGFPSQHLVENFKTYFNEESRKAYLIKVDGEIAGFALINKIGTSLNIDWNMGEFFVLAKFQGKKIASHVAKEIWLMHPGRWEVLVIPENKPALAFWRKNISAFTNKNYTEEIKTVDYDKTQPNRYVFNFDVK